MFYNICHVGKIESTLQFLTPTHFLTLPLDQMFFSVLSVFSGASGVMSGRLGVRLLLLLGCVCHWLPGLALAAVVISEGQESPQVNFSFNKSI